MCFYFYKNDKLILKICDLNKQKNITYRIINKDLKKLNMINNSSFQRFLICEQLNKTNSLYKLN